MDTNVSDEKKYLVYIYDEFYQFFVGRILQFDSLNECKAFYCSWLVGSDYAFKENTSMIVCTFNVVERKLKLSYEYVMNYDEANELLNNLEVPAEVLE